VRNALRDELASARPAVPGGLCRHNGKPIGETVDTSGNPKP
jgi:hypothetical protein